MSASELSLRRAVQVALSALGVRLFRNNTGVGYSGQVIARTADTITIRNPRRVSFGLTVGSSDLIGWTPITVTADMVGQPLAVFTAIELKTGRLRATREQANFLNRVMWAGGVAFLARSADEAAATLHSRAPSACIPPAREPDKTTSPPPR